MISSETACRSRKVILSIVAVAFAALTSVAPSSLGAADRTPPSDTPTGGRPERVALVVGINSYKGAELNNPRKDAEAIAATLEKTLGFKVITVYDATYDVMHAKLEEFKGIVSGSKVALVYFSGHGVQLDGKNYLIAKDANLNDRQLVTRHSFDVDDVIKRLAGAAVKIVILDACRDDPFPKSRGLARSVGLAQVNAPLGTLVAYATSPGEKSDDGRKGAKNGPYATHLLRALQRPGLSVEGIFKATRVTLVRANQETPHDPESSGLSQVPWESSSLVGEPLVLLPRAAGARPEDGGESSEVLSVMRGLEANRKWLNKDKEETIFKDCGLCPEMAVLVGGSLRDVRVPRFAMGLQEVTFDEWLACVLDGGCARLPADHRKGRGKHPVVDVSWKEARQYVDWLSSRTGKDYRLPTETEWEFAARASSKEDVRPEGAANCKDCKNKDAGRHTAPVRSFKPNAFGLYDMLGNVWEWVEDCRPRKTDDKVPKGASARIEGGECGERGIRGGAFTTAAHAVHPATRAFFPEQRGDKNIGFRVAMTLE